MQNEYDDNNLFLKIINGEIPCNKVYEDDEFLCFHDINPKAPVHVLLVPKEKFVSFDDFVRKSSKENIYKFFIKASEIAHNLNLKSYRIVANCGAGAGQIVFHYHLHIMGYFE